MSRRSLLITCIVAVAVGGCSTSGARSTGSVEAVSPQSMAPSAGSDLDRAFIDMMVPHRQAAVDMARIALERATKDELRSLADDIIEAQEAEIAQLLAWRMAWFGDDEVPGIDAMPLLPGMDVQGMEGHGTEQAMDMTADIEFLLTAEPFDRAFIEVMIPHHESGIEAARLAADATDREGIEDIAADIFEAHQREIDQMQGWLNAWYPS
jgi:uncharacterized protein (DUF305 family)